MPDGRKRSRRLGRHVAETIGTIYIMKIKFSVCAGIAIAVALVSCSQTKKTSETDVVAENDSLFVKPLRVEGTALLNSDNDTVVLTGPSFGWHGNWGRFYTPGSVKAIKEKWGANITRAAIGAHTSGDVLKSYEADSAYAVNSAIAVIDAAIDNDMYVICDWHSHDNTKENAKKFFETISKKYGDDPHIIYEIWNEPLQIEWQEVKDYAAEVIPVIRKNAPGSVVIVGTPSWDQEVDKAASDPLKEKNVVYALHFYAATHKDYLRERAQQAIDSGLPLFISECGSMEATGDGPIDHESWQAWVDLADRNKLSMLMWSISDKVETCSMLTPDSPSDGMQWTDDNLKEWGKLVRETTKTRNSKD